MMDMKRFSLGGWTTQGIQ